MYVNVITCEECRYWTQTYQDEKYKTGICNYSNIGICTSSKGYCHRAEYNSNICRAKEYKINWEYT